MTIKNIPQSLLDAVNKVLMNEAQEEHPMIEVDGAMKHRLNSLGQPIHHTDEGIRNFHRWFGNSTTVDEHGRPKVMYHGTGAILTRRGTEGGIREFKSKSGIPHWVTDDPKLAHGYSGSSSTSNILPVYIKSISPYKSGVKSDNDWAFTKQDVKKRVFEQSPLQDKSRLEDHVNDLISATGGYDNRYQTLWNAAGSAARFKNMGFDSIHHFERGANTYAVMDSSQIKSALSNSGRFKQNSNQIDESVSEHPMIEVDGQMKHRHNSLGQPIHHTEDGIKNFHRWFGDSKAVDEHGRPQVLYHGTNQDFDSFDFEKARENGKVWLSNNPKVASNFALYRTVWNNANVLPVYVKTKSVNHVQGDYKNIRDVDADSADHHATVFHNVRDPVSPSIDPISDVWAVSKHADLKSALGNSGAFSHPTKITESTEHPMIEVDGVMKHRHNSLGQPIHHTDDGIKNFHRWFGDSKAVDEHGRPLVVYHGTTEDFEEFDNTKTGKNDRGLWGRGHYFSTAVANANSYALRQGDNAHVIPTYVSIKSPLILKTGKDLVTRLPDGTNYREFVGDNLDGSRIKNIALSNGHDGTIQIKPDGSIGDLVAYNPHQIKSAHGNSGAFSHPTKITESTKVYYRGTNNKNEPDLITSGKLRPSIDHLTGKSESGVSVSDVPDVGKYFSYLYKVTGTELPRLGSDGEPLLDPKTMTFIKWIKSPTLMESEDYRESHTAPKPENSSPAHDLTHTAYPEDFYSSKGARLYGDGRDDDYKVHSQLRTLQNRPEAEVNIYRAVPNDSKITDINAGDWVTTNLQYAHDHGERFDGHKILSKRVKANEIFTDGNSFHEFGYHPAKD